MWWQHVEFTNIFMKVDLVMVEQSTAEVTIPVFIVSGCSYFWYVSYCKTDMTQFI